MATAIDIHTRQPVRLRRVPRRELEGDADARLIRAGTVLLEHIVEWESSCGEGLTLEESEARWELYERRFYALRRAFYRFEPTTLRGLALAMRCEIAMGGGTLPTAAMLRPSGPTAAELEESVPDGHTLWGFIDQMERIAGLRDGPAAA